MSTNDHSRVLGFPAMPVPAAHPVAISHYNEIGALAYYGECASPSSGATFFDFISAGDNQLGVFLGEILAEKTEAEVVQAGIHSFTQDSAAADTCNIADTVRKLNRILWQTSPDDCYTSLFCSYFDPVRRQLHYINAGHEPALLIRSNGEGAERLENSGTVLGLSLRATFHAHTHALNPGDTLVALTGGVNRISDPDESRLWEACAIGAVRLHPQVRTSDLVHYILDAFEQSGPGWRTDDWTIVVVRFRGSEASDPYSTAREEDLLSCVA